ncbi:hypothetical protein [Fodinicurvata sp. EGI_FJ10296]|uniref:hypothetical protein n=1 Tax=Fodinicurvata sp. EGI_FJ10296 TaxID=3231908 RepID=UPI003456F77D
MNVVRSISGGLLAGSALALVAAVPASGLLASAVEAQEAFAINASGWEGGAYAEPGSDNFSHCGISRDITEDLTVVFSLNPRRNLNVGFLRPSWSMAEGTEADVTLDVDGSLSRDIGALPASPNLLIVPLGRDADLVEALKLGRTMNAEINHPDVEDGSISVPLTGTMVGLNGLEDCIDTALEMGVADASAPETPQEVPGIDPSAPMDRQTLAELLRAAGFEEIRFAPEEQVPEDELELNHVWQVGPVVGGLHQVPRGGPEVEIDAFGDAYVDVLAGRCPGALETEVSETHIFDNEYALRYDLVECTADEGAAYVALLFTLDDYHYSAFFHEGDPENRGVAEEATLRIDQVIRSLAGFDTAERVDEEAGDGEAAFGEGELPEEAEEPPAASESETDESEAGDSGSGDSGTGSSGAEEVDPQ